MALWQPTHRPRILRTAALAASETPAPGPAQPAPQPAAQGPQTRTEPPPLRGEGPQRQKRLYGLPGSPQGLLSPIPGSRSFRPQIFEDEAPGRAATREEVAAKAISIPSDASSAFRAKQTLWSGSNERPLMAESRPSRTARIDPFRPFTISGANVGYPIAKRSFNDSDKIDGSCRVARGNFTPGRSQNRA